ncbi:MAG: iron-only hydrogenase system regulator [Clostridia bacterium]|nr:iron-only hydrogenase system regulator [Clostridia bacterium]
MSTRVAIIGVIIENPDSVNELNNILHNYNQYIIGRMGIPYPKKRVNVLSIAIDAKQDIISALSGKIGRIKGISTKTLYSKI